EPLDAVGTFVNHGDARIAHELLHAVLGDVAVAAIDLLGRYRVGEALVGQHALDDRGEQAHVIVGRLPLLLVIAPVGNIALEGGPQHQGARRFVEGLDGQQAAAYVGVDDDRVGRLVG